MIVKYKLTNFNFKFLDNISDFGKSDSLFEVFTNNIIILLASLIIFIFTIIMFIPFNISLLFEYVYVKFNGSLGKKYTLKVINKYYNEIIPKNRYYYLQGYKHQNISLERFIHKFISVYNDIYPTYEVGDNYYICDTGRRRSAHDIYLICKNYYEGITIDDVLTILVNLRNDNIIKGSYCTNICIYVYHNTSNHRNDNDNTEYGNGIKFKDLINAYKE